ncbi:MAG: flagellar motor switch protein FliG [Sulfitobacter sp.]|nr:flagellar motor switch protein FliG [Sulfitobacter sp.]
MNDMVPMNRLTPLPLVEGSGAGPSLDPAAKAAIVVRLLLNEGADLPLEELPDDLQIRLTRQMGEMRVIDRDTMQAVVEEFVNEVEGVGLHFPSGIAGALGVLDGTISKHTAARLRQEAGVRQYGDPWTRLAELGVEKLVPVFETESVEIAAVALSKLPVSFAAELLGKLPGPRARKITYAVSLTSAVTPEAVDRIGLSLASQLDAQPAAAFDAGPVERVGAILNSSTNLTRTDVLTGLDETDQGFANAVRKAIFTFAHIPKRIAPRDIPRILREIEQPRLVLALAGAPAAGMEGSRDFILENMSGRLADQLREEIEEQSKVKASDAEEAMAEVVEIIRRMEQSGDLLLVVNDEEEDAS